MSTNLALALFAVFLIAVISIIIIMFVSLAKQGDERRKMIVEKASAGIWNRYGSRGNESFCYIDGYRCNLYV